MKEILEKFGLTEFFVYICPGAILLSSFILWVDLTRIKEFLGEDIIKQELVIAVFILIFSYTLGLIASSLSSYGAHRYIREKGRQKAFNRKGNILTGLSWVFYWLPEPHKNIYKNIKNISPIIETKFRIIDDIQQYSGLQGISSIKTPWDLLLIYRTIMMDRVGNQGRFILTEADSIHRRFLFSQGVGFAFLLVAAQSLIKFLLHFTSLKSSFPCTITPAGLVAITLLGAYMSFILRIIASHWWEDEFLLTSILSQVDRSPRQEQELER